jgi:hypothetical protein
MNEIRECFGILSTEVQVIGAAWRNDSLYTHIRGVLGSKLGRNTYPDCLSMALQPFVGPCPLFQFLNPIHSR